MRQKTCHLALYPPGLATNEEMIPKTVKHSETFFKQHTIIYSVYSDYLTKTRLFSYFMRHLLIIPLASERRDANATVECSLHNPRIISLGNEHVVFDWPLHWALTLESWQTRRVYTLVGLTRVQSDVSGQPRKYRLSVQHGFKCDELRKKTHHKNRAILFFTTPKASNEGKDLGNIFESYFYSSKQVLSPVPVRVTELFVCRCLNCLAHAQCVWVTQSDCQLRKRQII